MIGVPASTARRGGRMKGFKFSSSPRTKESRRVSESRRPRLRTPTTSCCLRKSATCSPPIKTAPFDPAAPFELALNNARPRKAGLQLGAHGVRRTLVIERARWQGRCLPARDAGVGDGKVDLGSAGREPCPLRCVNESRDPLRELASEELHHSLSRLEHRLPNQRSDVGDAGGAPSRGECMPPQNSCARICTG